MIHIAESVCLNRHVIVMVAYCSTHHTPSEMIASLKAQVDAGTASGKLSPRCAICGIRNWHYRDVGTHFTDVHQAVPFLYAIQHNSIIQRSTWGANFN